MTSQEFTNRRQTGAEPTVKRIGLTGGIATGKSTVLQRWLSRGVPRPAVLDSDRLAHGTYLPGTATYAEIVQAFGTAILNPDGTVDRARLGERVFAEESQRLALNRIVHPAVRRLWQAELAQLAAAGQTAFAVVAIPLLYEAGAEQEFDAVVAVGCSVATQLARLTARGLSVDQAHARLNAQWPLPAKLDRANFVIWNDGLPVVLEEQADMIWATLKETAHAPSQN